MLTQRDGVYNACLAVMSVDKFDEAFKPTTEQRKQIIAIVTSGLMDGEITLSDKAKAKYNTEEKMRGYVNGLVSNWLRKDLNLNGNIPHVTKNPGSRAGSSDPVVRELRKLVKTLESGSAEHDAVEEEIAKRVEIAKLAKAKTVTIDIDQIPEELRHLIPGADREEQVITADDVGSVEEVLG